jgi:hypothetical protein
MGSTDVLKCYKTEFLTDFDLMTTFHSTNAHPISPIPSPLSDICSQHDVFLSAFNFLTFSILRVAQHLIFIIS